MKRFIRLDAHGFKLMGDELNQDLVKELIRHEDSASGLSRKLKRPVATIWRRLKLLDEAGIVEQSGSRRVGNMEVRLYRASATLFIPPSLIDFSPSEPHLREALLLYSKVQGEVLNITAKHNDIPEGVDPYDYSLFIDIFSFADYFSREDAQAKVAEIKRALLKSPFMKLLY